MKYTEEHVWMRDETDAVAVGLTEQGAELIGDIVFVELPEVGTTVTKDEEIIVVESAENTVDVLAPIDGEIVEINEALVGNPIMVNEDSAGDGWLVRIEASEPEQMDDYMSEAAYLKFSG